MRPDPRLVTSLLLVSLITCGPAIARKMPAVQLGQHAEVTFDGLHLVNKSRLDKVWVKPEIDLGKYEAVMFEGAGISYRDVNYNRTDRSAREFPLTDSQKSQLEDAVRESFQSEFRKFEHFVVTDKPGWGTLKVTVALIDVVSHIPPEPFGRGDIYIRDLGEATLVVEVFDSVTGEILARVTDKENVEPAIVRESNPATNLQEVRRSVQRWGAKLRQGMDELHEIGCYVCSIPGSVE